MFYVTVHTTTPSMIVLDRLAVDVATAEDARACAYSAAVARLNWDAAMIAQYADRLEYTIAPTATPPATRYLDQISFDEYTQIGREAEALCGYAALKALRDAARNFDESMAATRVINREYDAAYALICEAHGVVDGNSPAFEAQCERDERRHARHM